MVGFPLPILTKPFFADFPIAMGQNVITMKGQSTSIVMKAIHKIETTCGGTFIKINLHQRSDERTSQEDHTITEFRMKNPVNCTLYY
jgi:hypothetical protein